MGEKGLGLGKKGLGGSRQALGSSKVLQQPDEYAEGSLSWATAAREVSDGLADEWFQQYKPTPASKVLPKNAFLNQDAAKNLIAFSFFGEEETKLIPDLVITPESLGEQVPIEETKVGLALIEALSRNEINWFYRTQYPIDHFRHIELDDVKDEGIAQWATYFGMPLAQTFRVYRDDKGNEKVYWSAPMLVSTRDFTSMTSFTFGGTEYSISEEDLKKGAIPFGEWSTKLFIPAFLKRLFFLAETPFPSQIFSMSRSIAFKDLDESAFPKPAVMHRKNHFVQSAFATGDEGFLYSGTFMPDVIEAGWLFSTEDQEEIQTILEVVTSGLTKLATYLEDGYLNYRTNDYPFPYDNGLLAGVTFDDRYVPGLSALGRSQWIPGVRIGILLNETNELTAEYYADPQHNSHSAEFRNKAELIVFDGAGAFVPSMTDTLTYSWLLNEKNWGLIDQVQSSAEKLGVANEAANVLSNWGIAKYLQGQISEAIELFNRALEDPELLSESEATFYLSKIYAEKGEASKSEVFRQRCIAAGGYATFDGSEYLAGDATSGPKAPKLENGGDSTESVPQVPSSGSGLSKKTGGGLGVVEPNIPSGQAKFCPNCGTGFGSPSEKFCAQCGSKRE